MNVQEEGEEAGGQGGDSEDDAGEAAMDPVFKKLMSQPDGLQIMLRARKMVCSPTSVPSFQ